MTKLFMLAMLVAGSASAHAYPPTTQMSCKQARGIVQRDKIVWLSTGYGYPQQFVASGFSCATNEEWLPAWVPTADKAQCRIGFYCQPIVNGG